MRYFVLIIFASTFFSCTKDSAVNGNGMLLTRVTTGSKTYESFQYNTDGQLSIYKYFGFCETSPMDEDNFMYENKRLKKLGMVTRSLYSSTTATCDPASGISSENLFEYNVSGQLVKIIRQNSFSELIYNSKDLVEKLVLNGGGLQSFYLFEYDSRGNITKQTDPQGTVTTYNYDDKFNPYYLIRHRPNLITAYNSSPNNVIRSTSGGYTFTRHFEYNRRGLPISVSESTASTIYQFEYR